MENLIKGYITSLIGLIGIVAIGLHLSGVLEFPNPDFLDKETEAGIALIGCIGLFILPYSKIEAMVESIINFIIDKFKK